MTDETPHDEVSGPDPARSGESDGQAWTDDLLARARARSLGQPTESEDPRQPSGEAPLPAGPSHHGPEPTLQPPVVRSPIVTRADLTGGTPPPAASLDGTFSVSTAPLPPEVRVEAPQEVDLGIPGRGVSARRSVLEWGSVLLGALVLAMLVRAFVFQAFYIPSPSMEPTLWSGDRILVNKVSYDLHDVNRGDIVVFRAPPGSGIGDDDLIKRVIALPGERVTAEGGRLLIDGGLLIEPYLPYQEGTAGFGMVPWCADGGDGACTVPDGHVFVMGDNRPNSRDSRYFGPVPIESIVGRAFVRVWPLGALDRL